MTIDSATVSRAPVAAGDVNGLLTRHIARNFGEDQVSELRAGFAADHIVPIRGLCPPDMFGQIRDEACGIMARYGTSHDLSFAITDNTPRSMTTVGQPVIKGLLARLCGFGRRGGLTDRLVVR